MSFAPTYPYRTGETTVGPFTRGVALTSLALDFTPSQGAVAWGSANNAQFYPVGIPEATTLTKFWWLNGSTISTPGSVDVGIFKTDGSLVISAGSTTPSGTTTMQLVDVTDTVLGRGLYYVGMTASVANVANYTINGSVNSTPVLRGLGVLEMASCAPPFTTNGNPATFAVLANHTRLMSFGFIAGLGL